MARPRTTTPTTTTPSRARERTVTTSSGMTAGQACEPGLTDCTSTNQHSGREKTHIRAGPTMASPAAMRATSQVRRDGPCHSSATK